MRIFEANISLQVCEFLKDFLKSTSSFKNANQKIFDAFGINIFFENDDDYQALKESVSVIALSSVEEPDRAEYGDFQTNKDLANKIAKHLAQRNISPEIVVEPTCGKGNFIIASLSNFKAVKKVFGIEIYGSTAYCVNGHINIRPLLAKNDFRIRDNHTKRETNTFAKKSHDAINSVV